jgi:hypothetical protein
MRHANRNVNQNQKQNTKRQKPLNNPRHVAFHEAGHAVIARVLTLACGGASIVPDQESAGQATVYDPYTTLYEWEKRGKIRDADNAMWHGHIIALMAAAEAEAILLGVTEGGSGQDQYVIEAMLNAIWLRPNPERSGQWPLADKQRIRVEARLRRMAKMLVRRHRGRIESVASALLAERSLSCEQLDQLTGRSIDDVVPNAPFLLAIYRDEAGKSLSSAK